MRILGIDQATSCGWAILDNGQVLDAGAADLSIITKATKTKEVDPPALRLHKLKTLLNQKRNLYDFDRIAYEKVTGGLKVGGAAGNLSRHFEAVIMLWAFENDVPVEQYAAGTIKKHATGDGSWQTKKEHMIAAAVKRWPGFMASKDWGNMKGVDDMADALWIADLDGCKNGQLWD